MATTGLDQLLNRGESTFAELANTAAYDYQRSPESSYIGSVKLETTSDFPTIAATTETAFHTLSQNWPEENYNRPSYIPGRFGDDDNVLWA